METGESQTAHQQEDEPALSVDFRRYFAALRKYLWLMAALSVLAVTGAVLYTLRVTPIYEAKASVQIEPRLPDLLGTGDLFNVAAGTNTAEYYKQQKQILDSYMLCRLTVQQFDLSNKLLTESETKALSHDDQMDLATTRLVNMITIKYPEQDRIMYVYVRNSDAKLATDMANDHVETYMNYAKGLLSESSTQATVALLTEFNDKEAKLRAAEDKIYKFQADNDMIAVTLEEHQSLVSSNILNFTQKLNDARANEIALAAKLGQMRKASSEDVLATPIAVMTDNPSFDTLRAQYYTEKIHLLELAKDLGPKNPDYLAQKQKVDELYHALETEVKVVVDGAQSLYSAAQTTDDGLNNEVERYKAEAKALSPKIVTYNEYQREKKMVEDEYNILRARLSATQMTNSMSSAISNVHTLDPALLPTKPVSPNMAINVAVGGILSVFLGLLVVFLLVFLDRSIKTAADVLLAVGAPVLGIIPALGDEIARSDLRGRDMYVHENPHSNVAECCRVLRTNLMFSAADQTSLKTIVVSSANAQEGKTTTVMYLGTTMAQSGQRVLLIDTDMRRPRLHVSTNVRREPGLSTLLLGEDNYDDVIKSTEIPNLFVLPCGPLPPNPAELLLTKRFETVLEELGKRFDKVILDSPPLVVTDAIVLAKRSEGVLLVARAGRTDRDELKRSARAIRAAHGSIFGVVLNELDRNERGASYYYSYYGYGKEANENEPSAA